MKTLINATGTTEVPVDGIKGPYVQVALGNQKGLSETITVGTLTVRARAVGGYGYAALVGDNTIDCSDNQPIVIGPNAIEALEFTAAGVDASGSVIEVEITSVE